MNFRKIIALSMAAAITFGVTGCAKKEVADVNEAMEVLESAKAKVASIENYDGEMSLDFEFENNEGVKSAQVFTDITMFEAPDLRHIEINTDFEGNKQGKSEFYVEEANGKKVIYMLYGDKWYLSDIDDETLFLLLGHYDMKEIINTLLVASTEAKVAGEETINGIRTTRIDAVIAEDLIANTLIYTGTFVATGMGAITPEHLNGAKAMDISFFIDDNDNVVAYSFDAGAAYQAVSDNLFELVKGQPGYEEAKKLLINKYLVKFTMNNIGDSEKIKVSEEALNGTVIDENTVNDIQTQSN